MSGLAPALGAFGVIAARRDLAGLGANAILPGRQSPLVLELPPLRLPIPRQVLAKAWHRFRVVRHDGDAGHAGWVAR